MSEDDLLTRSAIGWKGKEVPLQGWNKQPQNKKLYIKNTAFTVVCMELARDIQEYADEQSKDGSLFRNTQNKARCQTQDSNYSAQIGTHCQGVLVWDS